MTLVSKANFNNIKEMEKITIFLIEDNIILVKPNGPNNSKKEHPPNSFTTFRSYYGLQKEKHEKHPMKQPN